MQMPATTRRSGAPTEPGSTPRRKAVAPARTAAEAAKNRRVSMRSASPSRALTRQPITNPTCTAPVNAACMKFESPNSATSDGTTAEAENHRAIAATWLTAMIATDAGLEEAHTASDLRQRDALLTLVFSAAILVRGLAHLVGLEEDHLRHAFVGVDLRRQRGRIREFEGDEAFPLRLERRHVHDDAAARIRRFAERDREHAARDAEILDRARKRKRIRRYGAGVALEVDEGSIGEVLGIDDGRVEIREQLEFVRAADVVAVARRSV